MKKIYVCGPTVYNDVHIGNLRPILTVDLILKAARYLGVDFYFVHNITDIDDKIINRALNLKISEQEVAQKYTDRYLALLKSFNVDTISKIELVTENLSTIETFIQQLLKTENAYIDNRNNVWFDVKKNEDNYGTVSNQKITNMIFEDEKYSKRFAADFALWKNTEVGIKYDLSFGAGRPGWHTECAALIQKNFGTNGIDIHGGGMDLTFPHHENENIQYFALNKVELTKKWLRAGQLNLNGEKMSKSLQNVILAKDFLKQYPADYLKTFFLLNSLTGIINLDDNLVNNVKKMHQKIKKCYFLAFQNKIDVTKIYDSENVKDLIQSIYNCRFSDFNAKINSLLKSINREQKADDLKDLVSVFNILGYDFLNFEYQKHLDIFETWKELVANKKYEESDLLRKILLEAEIL
ncbi:class I tRNA ligase family protein [Mycoplasma buteonis]|uniref:class I tRNA ligase family protein n=1 Tax=Mycoplasma buteonis TaxID=171280 RepID=UPI00056BAA08|nr:class I tRNA ligase family protein [Mycoplasma buteonis]